jgi:EmrB/QacA subfamily drug resistance transporter
MYGRKRIFQVSVAIFLVGSVLCGVAPSIGALIAFRALQGIGGGGLNSLVMAIVGDVVPARRRGTYQAITGAVATIALIGGPLLGGLFSDTLSWRWVFYLNIPIGVVALITIAAWLHLPRRTSTGRLDIAGGVLATVFTTAALLVATFGGDRFTWGSVQIVGLVVVAITSLGAYVLVERRAAEPITPLHLFRIPTFSISAAQFLLATLVLFVAMLYAPMFLQQVQGYSAFRAGLFTIPLLVGLVLATMIAGPAIARTGRYKQYPVIGAVLAGAGMWWLAQAGASTAAIWIVVPLAVTGAGVGLFVQVALLAGQNAVAQQYLGVATGALNFFKSVGGAFGAAIFGAVLTAGLSGATTGSAAAGAFQTVFAWSVPFMVVALVLAVLMPAPPLSDEMLEVAEGKVEVPEY